MTYNTEFIKLLNELEELMKKRKFLEQEYGTKRN